MLIQYNAYVIVLLSASVMMAGYAIAAVRREPNLTEWLFIGLVGTMAVWNAAYGIQLMSLEIAGKMAALTFVYGAAMIIPVWWLLFVIAHTGKQALLTAGFVTPLVLIPVATILLTATAQQHNLMFVALSLFEENEFILLRREFGPFFWLSIMYSYALLTLASIYLLRRIHYKPDTYRGQSILLFSAMFVPWVSNIVSIVALDNLNYNLTPVAFTITAVLVGYDLFRLDVLDLHPLARDVIFENVNAMVFVIDAHERVRDMNPAAERELDLSRSEIIGMDVKKFYTDNIPEEMMPIYDNPQTPYHTTVNLSGRVYDVNITPIFSRDGTRYHGRVTTMHEITELVETREAERQQRQFALALTEGMAALAANLEEGRRSLFKQIIERVGYIVAYDRASIAVIDGEDVTFIAHIGYTSEHAATMENFREPLTTFPRMRKLMQTKEPELVPHVKETSEWAHFDNLPVVHSYIGMPIVSGEEVIGVLNLDHNTPGYYTPEHVERLRAFASQAAVALANTRLVENLRLSADELAMRNADLDAFSYTVAHDLRAPLNRLQSLLKTLNETIRGDLPEEYLPAFDDTLEVTDKMNTMILSLLNIARASGTGREGARPVHLTQAAEEAAKRFVEDVSAGVALYIAPHMPTVMGHPILIEEVLANLIGNAMKYMGETSKPWVAVNAVEEECWVRVIVEDNGPGLSEGHEKRVREQFSEPTWQHRPGHGLGLSIVHRIVTRLGGQVGYESREGGGSRFWLTLPLDEKDIPSQRDISASITSA